MPWVAVAAAEIKEFEGALGAVAGGDVALIRGWVSIFGRVLWMGGWWDMGMYMCARFPGTISRSSPTRALPVARILFSPLAVRGSSVVPV